MNRPYRSPIEIPELVKEYIRGKKFCEIGCGDGDLLREFAKYSHKAVGVEMNPDRFPQLDILEAEVKNIKIYKGDVLTKGKALMNELLYYDVYFVWTQPRFDKEIFKVIPKEKIIISYKTAENIGWLKEQYNKYPGETEWIEFTSNEDVENYTSANILAGKKFTVSKSTPMIIGILHK